MSDDRRFLARWSVRVVAAAISVLGLAGVLGGVAMVVTDEASHDDEWDGLGTFFGLLAGGFGLLILVVGALAVWLAGRHLFAAALVVCVFGVVVAGLGWAVTGAVGMSVSVPLVLGGLVLGGVGFGAALGSTGVTIDSAGGRAR